MDTLERTQTEPQRTERPAERATPGWERGLAATTCIAMVPTMASPALTIVGVDPFAAVLIGLGATIVTLVAGCAGLAKRGHGRPPRPRLTGS